jgi:hypothetical protein
VRAAVFMAIVASAGAAAAYPTDAFERTGIRRLTWQREVDAGAKRGIKMPAGGRWPDAAMSLRLTGPGQDFRLGAETAKDPLLQEGLTKLLKQLGHHRDYAIAVLDITNPAKPRYAARNETWLQTPGSVAKLLVGAALFAELAKRYPADLAAREALLRGRTIAADEWAMPNSHEVPIIGADGSAVIRAIERGDSFSLWEWLDHMLSPSSNAAATIVWREAILMHLLGPDYPPAAVDDALMARWDKATFTAAAFEVLDAPLRAAGIDPATFQLRLFFTRGPSKYLASRESRVSALALAQWMTALEQGRMVDAYSSLELKKLLYLTRRRVRYAKAAELTDAALFFKSGSLFKCQEEAGYVCIEYQGNVVNVLTALVTVEAPPEPGQIATSATAEVTPAAAPAPSEESAAAKTSGVGVPEGPQDPVPEALVEDPPAVVTTPTRVYIVSVMSNELKKNAANDHQQLAGALHRLLQQK